VAGTVSAVSWTAEGLQLHSPSGERSGPVRALAFDLGGTLDADGLGWAERFAEETDETLRGRRVLLERLAARVPLAVVSNGCGNSARLVTDAGLADLFAVVVDSSEAGYWKPDPRILEPVRRALDVPADAVAVVGDRVDRDGDAARSAGMQTVWVTGSPAPASDDPRLARVEAAVSSVTALDPERPE
jgi:HAD superfamily hydrolase (TIGR01509 family)